MRFAKLLVVSMAAVVAAPPALALTEAETRAFIDEIMSFHAARPDRPGGIVTSAEPTYTAAGEGYVVLLPGVALDLDVVRIELGDIPVLVRPEQGERLQIDMDLPERIQLRDPAAPGGEIVLGDRRFTGVWDPAIFAFATMEMAIDGIEVRPDNEPPGFVERLIIERESAQVGDALWDIATTLHIDGLTGPSMGGPPLVQVEALTARTQMEGVDLGAYAQLVRRLQFDPMAFWSPQGRSEEALIAMADFYETVVIGRIDSSFALAGLRVSGAEMGTDADVSIGQMLFESSWRDNVAGRGTLGTRMALGGVDTSGLPIGPLTQLVPQAFDLDLEITQVPLAEAIRRLSTTVAQLGDTPEAGAMMPLILLGELQQLVTTSDVVLRIRQATLTAPAAMAGMRAEARVDPASPLGAVGELTLELDGLGDAIEIIQGDPANQELAGAAGMLMLLQGLGEPVPEAAGRLRYHFQLGADGVVLLNGQDVSPLMEMMQQ